MVDRKILVVDDNKHTEEVIEEYLEIYEELHEKYNFRYKIEFVWEDSIDSALERLNNKMEVIDVAVIDYDFTNDISGKKGIHLVKKIRETINKRCKIVFYSMHGLAFIGKEEFVNLINNDVFRFISKSGETLSLKYEEVGEKADQLIVEAIIDALDSSDPISNTLENYLINYYDVIKNVKISVDGKEYSIKELINAIRLYEEPGNTFVANLLEMSIAELLEAN